MDAFQVDTTYRSRILRLDSSTKRPILLEPDDQDPDYQGLKCVPPDGEYTLIFSGISEKRTELNKFYEEGKPGSYPTRDASWLEFTIVKGHNLTGRWFSNKMTWAFGERATFGKFLRKLNGGALPSEVWSVGDFLGRQFTATIAEGTASYAPILIATVKPLNGAPIGTSPEGPANVTDEQPQAIVASQRSEITKAARKVFGVQGALPNLNMYLLAAYNVTNIDALSYGDADAVLYELETVPDEVKEVIKQAMAAQEDYSDTPALVQ